MQGICCCRGHHATWQCPGKKSTPHASETNSVRSGANRRNELIQLLLPLLLLLLLLLLQSRLLVLLRVCPPQPIRAPASAKRQTPVWANCLHPAQPSIAVTIAVTRIAITPPDWRCKPSSWRKSTPDATSSSEARLPHVAAYAGKGQGEEHASGWQSRGHDISHP
jgi:hypothetical protein